MKHQYLLTVAGCLFANTAIAGGLADPIIPAPLPVPPAPIAQPLDWYAGLQAGPGEGEVVSNGDAGEQQQVDLSGPFFGLHAGVQRQFGSLTAGIEIDYNTSNVDLEDSGTDTVIEMDTLAHLKLRAGTEVGPAFIYGTAGLAYASLSAEPVVGDPFDESDTAPFYGLGADVMVSQNISVGGEVLVHNFEDFSGEEGLEVDLTTAMLRVSYHF
ncbi:outer membrane beta-barrel protein [Yoonia sp. BS5-3]|uniref:Outer membrane protein n=1 Tax=Yoonia phaeophyticola TaxID=3137369 RepID=A0ABZ2V850_9RHOB